MKTTETPILKYDCLLEAAQKTLGGNAGTRVTANGTIEASTGEGALLSEKPNGEVVVGIAPPDSTDYGFGRANIVDAASSAEVNGNTENMRQSVQDKLSQFRSYSLPCRLHP